jgi:ABC-type branched-subunit amino acid transport system substrate-binding protein
VHNRLGVIVLVALIGCHHHTRKTLAPELPHSGNPDAYARLTAAEAKFKDDHAETSEFARIAEEFPDDPIAPYAQVDAGISAIKGHKYADAEAQLTKAAAAKTKPEVILRATLYLGVVKNYRGDPAGALVLLKKAKDAVAEEDKTEFIAAVAFATAAGPEALTAVAYFDQLWPRVTAVERAVIRARVTAIVAHADPQALRALFDRLPERKGLGVAVVATRLALIADAAGHTGEAEKLREAAAPARAAVGLPVQIGDDEVAPVPGPGGEAGLVGAVLPLGGKQSRLGEDAASGLGLAAGVPDGKAVAAIELRSANDPTTAAAAVEELAKANAVAIIGPIDGASVDAAGARAEGLGIPLLSLATRPEERTTGKFVFHMRHSAEARARGLAARAIAMGVKNFAVLAPETGYGKAVTAAFEGEVARRGGSIAIKVTYPDKTKSFASFAGKLGGGWEGVFVPTQADELGLITPALAASGKIPKPVGTKKVTGGKPVLLLSTAEGLSAAYLADAGRHSEGALFAPGFYPDETDALDKPFIERFVASYGHPPGATEAYAYDAAQLAAAAGAGGRTGLTSLLAKGELPGLTGVIKFDSDHRRAARGVIYTVVSENGTFAIHVAK